MQEEKVTGHVAGDIVTMSLKQGFDAWFFMSTQKKSTIELFLKIQDRR